MLQECHDTSRTRFRSITPDKDKEVRFNAACAPVEEGKVFLPAEAPWLPGLKRELLGFPRARHEDQVDSFSQFLNWSKCIGFWRTLPRDHPMKIARRERSRNRPRQ